MRRNARERRACFLRLLPLFGDDPLQSSSGGDHSRSLPHDSTRRMNNGAPGKAQTAAHVAQTYVEVACPFGNEQHSSSRLVLLRISSPSCECHLRLQGLPIVPDPPMLNLGAQAAKDSLRGLPQNAKKAA